MSARKRSKSAFVTVGTTRFDDLIRIVSSKECLLALKSKGFSQITMQIGNSETEIPPAKENLIQINWYRFKPSIQEDINNADLIISHAGAGSVLETLRSGKPSIVVVNEKLMDNHQTELAEAFAEKNNLVCCNTRSLASTIEENAFFNLAPYSTGNTELFGAFLDEFMEGPVMSTTSMQSLVTNWGKASALAFASFEQKTEFLSLTGGPRKLRIGAPPFEEASALAFPSFEQKAELIFLIGYPRKFRIGAPPFEDGKTLKTVVRQAQLNPSSFEIILTILKEVNSVESILKVTA
eukprot:gene5906-6592_t